MRRSKSSERMRRCRHLPRQPGTFTSLTFRRSPRFHLAPDALRYRCIRADNIHAGKFAGQAV
jgi:hypothetical protein